MFDKRAATAKAQKIYSQKMKAEGKKQRIFWGTDEKFEAVKSFLEVRRKLEKTHEQEQPV